MAGADQKRANLPTHRSGHQPRDAGGRVRTSEELLTLAFVDQLANVERGNLTIGIAQSWIHLWPLSSVLGSRTAARSSQARSHHAPWGTPAHRGDCGDGLRNLFHGCEGE